MSLIIRPLTAADDRQWRVLWRGYLDYYETTLAPEIYDAAIGRMLSNDHPEYHGLVAQRDGKLVGLVHYITTHTAGSLKIHAICKTCSLIPRCVAKGSGAP